MRTRLLLSLLVTCGMLAATSAAHAASYTVDGCQSAPGVLAPMSGWSFDLNGQSSSSFEYWQNGCPGAVFMFMTANASHPDGAYASETFTAPPGTTINAYTFWRAVRLVPTDGYYYQAFDDTAGTWVRVDGCSGEGHCDTYGDYQTPTAPVNHWSVHPQGDTTQVKLELFCGKSGGCPPVGSNADSVWLFHTAVALEDDTAPELGAASGPLVAGGVLAGVEPVSISASDQGSGVDMAGIKVDGNVVLSQVLDNSTATCQPPFTAVVPCPLSASGTLALNTAALSTGTHTVQLFVADAAGNTTWGAPFTITTDNSSCSPVPLATGMTVSASFSKTIRTHHHDLTRSVRQLTIDYGRRPTVHGTLVDATGAPVANAPVCVVADDDYEGAALRPVATVQTDPTGHFSYRLDHGPSRTIYFIHRTPAGAIVSTVHVNVHVPVPVNVNHSQFPNGAVMTWTGRVRGPVPNGLIGLMQVWRGTYWETFSQNIPPFASGPVAIGHNGKWVAHYKFQFTTGVQHYLFRLRVPPQSQYPYAGGTSKAIRITVRQ